MKFQGGIQGLAVISSLDLLVPQSKIFIDADIFLCSAMDTNQLNTYYYFYLNLYDLEFIFTNNFYQNVQIQTDLIQRRH